MGDSRCEAFSDYLKLLQLVLDNEASHAEEMALLTHLDSCGFCRRTYEAEQKFRNLIKRSLQEKQAPLDLEKAINTRILLSLDSPE